MSVRKFTDMGKVSSVHSYNKAYIAFIQLNYVWEKKGAFLQTDDSEVLLQWIRSNNFLHDGTEASRSFKGQSMTLD